MLLTNNHPTPELVRNQPHCTPRVLQQEKYELIPPIITNDGNTVYGKTPKEPHNNTSAQPHPQACEARGKRQKKNNKTQPQAPASSIKEMGIQVYIHLGHCLLPHSDAAVVPPCPFGCQAPALDAQMRAAPAPSCCCSCFSQSYFLFFFFVQTRIFFPFTPCIVFLLQSHQGVLAPSTLDRYSG